MSKYSQRQGYNEVCKSNIPYAIRKKSITQWELVNRKYLPISNDLIILSKKEINTLRENRSSSSNSEDCIHFWNHETFSKENELKKFSICMSIILTAKIKNGI